MPSKSRAKIKSRKTQKKQKKQKKTGLTPRGIGVISTLDLGGSAKHPLMAALANGVNDATVTIYPPKDNLGYGDGSLKAALAHFNADANVSVIVTVGGSIGYVAANKYAKKSFVSLLGGTPPSPGSKFCGGVSLESYIGNANRIQYLQGKGYAPNQICLFCNKNSAMHGAETGNWPAATPVTGGNDSAGYNDSNTYKTDFGKIPASVTAVVISADPYFQQTKADLIAAANSSGKYICYPLQDFKNSGGTPPAAGRATLYGPALKDAYTYLGQQAARVINTGKTAGILSVPIGEPVPL
jgi:hypothetical protein